MTTPSVSTIWRVLTRRGFVVPEPHKRPKCSCIRFEADQPNERWQLDLTHWALAGGTEVEILNLIDDHSRLAVGSDAKAVFKAADVVTSFRKAAATWGVPAGMLSDGVHRHPPPRGTRGAGAGGAGGSPSATPGPTTPKPAGRSSGSTRRSSDGWPPGPRRGASAASRPRWTTSAATTTANGPTGP